MKNKIANLIFVLFLAASICSAQEKSFTIIVVEYGANRVGFFDSNSGKRIGSVAVGLKPHEIELSSDGKTAYVSNFGISDYDFRIGTPGDSVSVIDVRRMREKYRLSTENLRTVEGAIVSGKAPHGIKLRPPQENELFVCTEVGGFKMLVYDLKKRRLKRFFDVPEGTHNFIFSSDGKSLYLFAGTNGVFKTNPETGEILAKIKLETPVRGLSYTIDRRYIIAAAKNEAVLLNPETLAIERSFKDLGVGQILYPQPTPDGKYILLPAPNDGQVLVLDAASGRIMRRLKPAKTPLQFSISPDGGTAFVTSDMNDFFSQIDLKTFEFKNFAEATGANGIAITRIKPQSEQ